MEQVHFESSASVSLAGMASEILLRKRLWRDNLLAVRFFNAWNLNLIIG